MSSERRSSDSDALDPNFQPSPSQSPGTSPRPESSTQAQQRALYQTQRPVPSRSSPLRRQLSGSEPEPKRQRSNPPPSRPGSVQSASLKTQQNLPDPFISSPSQAQSTFPNTQQLAIPSRVRSSPLRQSHSPSPYSPLIPSQPISEDQYPLLRSHILDSIPPYRPNRYYGPASTYHSWIKGEYTIAASLDRVRAQDLAIHLYDAYALQRKAALTNRKRGRRSQSRGRSQTRYRSNSGNKADKGKGKARVEDYTNDLDKDREMLGVEEEDLPFIPDRHWTAWPLSPDEVPREEFLPRSLLDGGYRKPRDERPSAELEECLIALIARFARERWEAREWETSDSGEEYEEHHDTKHRQRSDRTRTEGQASDNEATQDDSPSSSSSHSPSPQPQSTAPAIQTFSSQAFLASPSTSPPSSRSSSTSQSLLTHHDSKPTFSTSDEHLNTILIPPTRHILSQLDALLSALHKVQLNNSARSRKQKTKYDKFIGTRGADDVLGLAGLWFGKDVVQRANERWRGLSEAALE